MFDVTEYWCKIWMKTDLYFLKWHKEFGKVSFSPRSTRCSVKTLFTLEINEYNNWQNFLHIFYKTIVLKV